MSRTDFLKRLLAELEPMRRDGTIDENASERIRIYCETGLAESGRDVRNVLRLFLALIGIALVGTGVALTIGYNWDMLPPWARLAMGFVPLLAALAAGFETLRRDRGVVWRECSALAIALTTAGSIAIVSQLYQLNGTFGDFMRINLVLMLPVIYLFRSDATAALYALGMFALLDNIWYPFSLLPMPLSFLIGLLPYLGWRLWRSPTGVPAYFLEVIGLAAVLSSTIGLCSRFHSTGALLFSFLTVIAAAIYAVGVYRRRFQQYNLLAITGAGMLFILAFLAATPAFHDVWRSHAGQNYHLMGFLVMATPLIVILLAALVKLRTIGLGFAAIAVLVSLVAPLLGPHTTTWLANGLLLACGVVFFQRGIALRSRGRLNLAMVIILLLAFFRLLDFNKNILFYAIGFIVAGVLFLTVNLALGRSRQGTDANPKEVVK